MEVSGSRFVSGIDDDATVALRDAGAAFEVTDAPVLSFARGTPSLDDVLDVPKFEDERRLLGPLLLPIPGVFHLPAAVGGAPEGHAALVVEAVLVAALLRLDVEGGGAPR